MSSNEYNQLLKFLYFEGYAESYAEAEELLESMSDEEFEKIFYEAKDNSYLETDMEKRKKNNEKAIEDMKKTAAHKDMVATVRKKFYEEVNEIEEEKKEFPTAKVERQIGKHTSKSTSSWSNKGGKSDPRKTSSYDTRSRKMSAVKSSVERGEDPRKDSVQGDQRKVFTKQFGTNVNAKTVDNEKSAYTPGGLRAHQTKAGGYRTLTRKEEFESVIEYLFVEGYADTIENAELMAENISETWVNEIMEAQVDWHNRDKENVQDRVKVLRDRNKRLEKDRPEIPSGRNQTDFRTKRHKDSRGKAGSVAEENYEIDEAAKDQSDKQIDQGIKKTYKAGNVLDNQHQGRSSGLNKLSSSERAAKTERMRSRLKNRRDDLFKEKGDREDAKREQLKKLLGL
jgi:hypothetical protein